MTTLFGYLKQTQRLLREENQELVNPQDLIDYINIARGQIAGEAECIRAIGTVSTVISQNTYAISAINFGVSATTGIQGAINIRRITYALAQGYGWIDTRPWEWFDYYHLNTPVPINGPPSVWSQYGQGAASSVESGSFYLGPPPDNAYTLYCDCSCFPINLVNNTTVEAIPYLWTDAVPFFAAYYAFMNLMQDDKAERMYSYYTRFVQRARRSANPSVGRSGYEQADDLTLPNKLGLSPKQGAA